MLDWFQAQSVLKKHGPSYSIRHAIANGFRPHLRVSRAWPREENEIGSDDNTRITSLLSINFECEDYPTADEILSAWPESAPDEETLLLTISATLLDALDEAKDAGLSEGFDRPSLDVQSVSHHPQNAHQRGFYPIIRL
jgi:hypothetical protein